MNKINISVVFNAINNATGGIDQVTRRLNRVNSCMWKMNQMSELWGRMANTMGQISAPGIALETSMAELSAITGIAGKELESLEKTARKIGKNSGLGATGAVEAYKLLASQIDVSKIGITGLNELQKNTITLAQASRMTMGDSANALAGTINQFGLAADQAGRVINVLAAGSKYGAAEIPELSQSFKVVGAAASAAGLSVEQTGGAIETLSKMNIKGSEAGTALRNVLLKMQTELGFDFKVTKLSDALKTLQGREGDAAYMAKVFGMENMAAAQFLVKNSDLVDEMTGRMTDTSVASEQAAINTDTFAHRMEVLKSKLNDLSISFFNNNKGLVQMVQMGGQGAQMLTSLAPIGGIVSGGLGLVGKGAKGAIKGVSNLTRASKLMKSAIAAGKMDTYANLVKRYGLAGKAAGAGIKISSAAQTVWNAVTTFTTATMGPLIASTWAWTVALLANPVTWIVVGVMALVAAIALAWKKFDWFRGAIVGTWEAIKKFGSILFDAVIEPIKKILSGIGKVGKAIGLLFKGKFSDAWDTAKEGFGDIAEGAIKGSPIGIAHQVISRRDEIVEAGKKGYEKGKAIDTSKEGREQRKDERRLRREQRKEERETKRESRGVNAEEIAGKVSLQKGKLEVPASLAMQTPKVPGVKVPGKIDAKQPPMNVVKAPGKVTGWQMPRPGVMEVPASMAMNQPKVPGVKVPGKIDAKQPPMNVVKAPGKVTGWQMPKPGAMEVPASLAMQTPKVPGVKVPGKIDAEQPPMNVVKAPGKVTGWQMPRPGVMEVPASMAMNQPKVPGVKIPGTIDAKQPEAKKMTIPAIVNLTTPRIEALNIEGKPLSNSPLKGKEQELPNLEAITRNITTNISKTENNSRTENREQRNNSAKIEVTYSPQVNISAAMSARDRDDLMKMLREDKDELMRLIREEMRKDRRLAYAG